jgi:HEAT repeat protein
MSDLGTGLGPNTQVTPELRRIRQLVVLAQSGLNIIAELTPFLAPDKSITTRAAAVGALRECGSQGLDHVVAALTSPDEIVAIMAIRSFQSLVQQGYLSLAGMSALADLVSCNSQAVRSEASRAIGDLVDDVMQALLAREGDTPASSVSRPL